jgi:hypothetical protein
VDILSTWLRSRYKRSTTGNQSVPHVTGAIALWIARHGRPVTGNAKDPAIRALLADLSEDVGSFKGDPDGIPEPMLNANTKLVGGTGTSVCCPAP